MKKNIIKIFKLPLIFIITIILFISLLTLSAVIPSELLKNNVSESSKTLYSEGNRKKIELIYKLSEVQLDNFSDALIINTAYSIDSSKPLYSSFVARKNYIPGVTKTIEQDSVSELKSASKYKGHNEVGELKDTVEGNIEESFEYARYWHGYLVILRPLLLILNIDQIRLVFNILLWILGAILIYLIYKKVNLEIATIFTISLVGVDYIFIGLSLQACFVFFIAIISSIILLTKKEMDKNIITIFFLVGMLTNFLDLLTVPMVTFGIPIILYFLLKQKEQKLNFKEIIIIFIKYGLAWVIGYALTWLTKWVLIDVLYQRNLFNIAIGQVLYRSIGTENFSYIIILLLNLYPIIPIIGILITITILFLIMENNFKGTLNVKEILVKILPYCIVFIMPFAWYFVLKDHSFKHYFFTYRNLILSLITVPIILLKILEKEKEK